MRFGKTLMKYNYFSIKLHNHLPSKSDGSSKTP